MVVPFTGTISLLMLMTRLFVAMAITDMRTVAMILRGPFLQAGAVAHVTAHQAEDLGAEERREAQQREKTEVKNAGVHGAIGAARSGIGQGLEFAGAAASRKTSICWPT